MTAFTKEWLDAHMAKQAATTKANRDNISKGHAKTRKSGEQVETFLAQLCKEIGLPDPVAEYRFHDTRKWRIDYYFEQAGKKVALEVEGGAWTSGRHTRGSGFIKDIEKYNALSAAGIYLVRTTPDQLIKQGLRDVLTVFENNTDNQQE